ncbi:MAG: Omp28-related outer membrane protein [Candidatus Cryptobacteroides sp.]
MMKKYISMLAAAAMFIALSGCTLTSWDDLDDVTPGNEDKPVNEELTIEVDEPVIRADGLSGARIIVKSGETPVTDGVSIYDASSNKALNLPGMVFTTEKPGTYSFWAAYKTKHTGKVSVTAVTAAIPQLPADPSPQSVSFKRRMLVTQFTGTGCGYCPLMTTLLRSFAEEEAYKDKYVHAACHTYNSNDPAYLTTGIDNAMSIASYPNGVINLDKTKKFSSSTTLAKFVEFFDGLYTPEASAGIAVSTVLDFPQLVVKASVKAAVDGEYHVAAWLLEDGINAVQTNYGYPGEFNTHNNCVRLTSGKNSATDFTGTALQLKAGENAEQYFIMDLKTAWVAENCHVIVFVSTLDPDLRTFTVNNVVDCRLDASVPFEYND